MIRMAAIIGMWAATWIGIGYCLPGTEVVTDNTYLKISDIEETIYLEDEGTQTFPLPSGYGKTRTITVRSNGTTVTFSVPDGEWTITIDDGTWQDD